MKLGVVGSRSFRDYKKLCDVLDGLNAGCSDVIISGGCSIGADALAERYAKERDVELKIFYAEWEKYGKRAGILRNRAIVLYCDFVVLFWDGISRGTASTLSFCMEFKVPFLLVWTYGIGGGVWKPEEE